MLRRSSLQVLVLIAAVTVLVSAPWWTPAGAPSVTHAQAAGAQAAPAQAYEGTLNIIWGDPQAGTGNAGETRYVLALTDGRQVRLEMAGHENAALGYFGKPVVVTGRTAALAAGGGGSADATAVVVDSIGPAGPVAQALVADGPPPAVSGTKRVLFLLLKFADDTSEPHPPSFYSNLTNPDTASAGLGIPATINGFFKKTSNNQFSWVGDVGGVGGIGAPGGWLTLPQPKSYYANCSFSATCIDIARITNDSVAAARNAAITLTVYDSLNFVYSNDLDCCAWGGGYTIEGKFYGVTWEPPWGQETRVYSHELGHSLGLPHSGWVYYAYDSPWDVMSEYSDAIEQPCGSYFSRNGGDTRTLTCREPGNGYIAAHRDYLGWIPSPNVVTTNTLTSSFTVTLEGAALPMGATPKLLKICLPGFSCTTGSGRYFTVEARTKGSGLNSLFDNGIPGEGVIIHDVQFGRSAISGGCYFNNQSGWAVPIDSTPGDYNSASCNFGGRVYPNYALFNAQFSAGQTYTNSAFGFSVSVDSRSGPNFVVTVQGTPPPSDIALDSPANGSTVAKPFTVQGWAINRGATSGTGVDTVHVYATPAGGGAATFLGVAAYGGARGDIAATYGPQFTNSGFTLSAGASLAAGTYTVTAYAHNAATGSFDAAHSATITISGPVSNGFIAVDYPSSGSVVTSAFEVTGWAIDQGADSGTGVDGVQFYIQPAGAPAPGVFVGTGSYGSVRNDVGAIFGSRFSNSGYHFTITGLGPLTGNLIVYAHSTVTGSYNIVKTVPITVNSNQLMSIDAPSPESTITGSTFQVAGWAIDRATASGTGVDALHIYAFPNPGSGEPAIFLGVATLGFARSDVEGIYGSRYADSGYALTVSTAAAGLTPGVYNIVVVAHSTSGSFNNLAAVRVTIQ